MAVAQQRDHHRMWSRSKSIRVGDCVEDLSVLSQKSSRRFRATKMAISLRDATKLVSESEFARHDSATSTPIPHSFHLYSLRNQNLALRSSRVTQPCRHR